MWEKPGKNVPLIYCHCIGFIGWIRIQLKEHTIIESHPESTVDDLRLDCPFPEMLDHFNSIKLNSREEVVKTPWLVVFQKTLERYVQKISENGEDDMNTNTNSFCGVQKKNPYHLTYQQKREFKEFLGQGGLAIVFYIINCCT